MLIQYAEPTAWADAFLPANFNALANNGGVLSGADPLDNSTLRLPYVELSFRMTGATMTPTAGAHLALYLIPLLDDGTTYADAETTTTAANLPPISYLIGSIAFRTKSASSQNGSFRAQIGPGVFKWYCVNRMGATLPSSATAMTCKFRLFGEEAA